MGAPDAELKWQVFLPLASRIDAAIISLSPDGEFEIKPSDGFILSMYWRSVRLFRATLLLLKADLPEEALIVARSLFVDSLRLLELAEAGNGRDALILHWANRSIQEQKGLIQEAARLGLENEPEQILTQLESERAKLISYARKVGASKFVKFQPVASAAKHFGRNEDLWTYLMSHEMVHGSDLALKFSRKKTESDSIAVYLGNHDPVVLLGVGLFGGRSVVDAAVATATIFDWSQTEIISSLKMELDDLDKDLTQP